MKKILLVPITAILICSGCGGNDNHSGDKQVVAQDPEKVNKLLVEFISGKLSNADTSKALLIDKDSLVTIPFVKQVYTKHGFKAFWSDKGKLNSEGQSLFSVIKDAESFGLIPDDYHFTAIDSLLKTSYDSVKENYNVTNLAHADVMMTDAFFTFAVHVSVGRVENDSSLARTWNIAKLDTDMVALFEKDLAKKDYKKSFEELEPQRREYQAIKKYMNDYRKKYAGVVWKHLPDRKKDSLGFFAGVKTRLIETGDYDSTSPDNDSLRISTALKKFQHRYFLEEDGKIGRNTILALDMLPEDWITQMAMNLERWRWEPRKFEKRYMLVDLAAFKMTVWEADSIFMESKIVCGAIKTQTPELDSKINQITLYPYWNVPYSISWKEILPHVQRDTGYLRKEHMEVLNSRNEVVDYRTIKWKKYGRGNLPYKFRQNTGDDNALGIMKFEFNNKYSVYMHDTNAKKYFRFTTRAFSHGCMRLEKFMDLAHFLIRDDSVRLPRDTFDRYTTLDSNMKITLRKPLPIHVRYFTCDVDTDGNVFIHTDIYLRDKRMQEVIYRQPRDKDQPKPALPENTTKVQERKKVMIRRRDVGFKIT
jgi:murein L,D-transpeptidase YcbB/YkuD